MRPHPRIRKTIKWGGAAVTVLIVVAWAVSELWDVVGYAGRWHVQLLSGGVAVMDLHDPAVFPHPSLYAGRHDGQGPRFWWMHIECPGVIIFVYLPFWLPATIAGACTLMAWRRDVRTCRRARAHLCANCSSDRAGLAPGAICPECGKLRT